MVCIIEPPECKGEVYLPHLLESSARTTALEQQRSSGVHQPVYSFQPLFRLPDPGGYSHPVGVVLGGELSASTVEFLSARFGRERVHQELARGRIAGRDQVRDVLEITARLFFGPCRSAG